MQTKIKTIETLDLEMPPSGGDLAIAPQTLEEEAHALRVMLDKAENFKVAVGQKLLELLNNHFGGNRNALRDWYEAEVAEGKAHRAWRSIEGFMGAINVHGERAGEVLAEREMRERDYQRKRQRDLRQTEREFLASNNFNNIRQVTPVEPKSEYEQRQQWLAQMDHLWFRGKPEWRKKWLSDRGLKS